MSSPFALGTGDIVVLSIIGLVTVAKTAWVTINEHRKRKQPDEYAGGETGRADARGPAAASDGFFLAGRAMPWWAIGLSMFASNIGAEHFVGQAGTAAHSGLAVALYEWTAGWLIVLLGWVFARVYLGLTLTTVGQWFELRFSPRARLIATTVSLCAYIVARIASTLYSGAVLFEGLFGASLYTSAPLILAFVAVYSAAGGLSAVMATDVGQAIIFVVGGIFGMAYSFHIVGGFSGLHTSLNNAGLSYFYRTLRPPDSTEMAWPGLLIGQPLASMWYWCIDQEFVQRIFAAKGLEHAQGGCLVAGFLKILPPFLMVFPGMIARVLYEECVASGGAQYSSWCDTRLDEAGEADFAYVYLIRFQFPDGMRGLMIGSMLLAMMSSLDSVFNSAATLVTIDIYRRFISPDATPKRLILCGRLTTFVTAALALCWLPVIESGVNGVYLTTQNVTTHLTPTIVAVFLLGLCWRRANGVGAEAGLVGGLLFGIGRFVAQQFSDCDSAPPSSFVCMDFNYFAMVSGAFTALVMVTASLLTAPPPTGFLDATTLVGKHKPKAAAGSLVSGNKQTTSLWVGAGKPAAGTSSTEPDIKTVGASRRARIAVPPPTGFLDVTTLGGIRKPKAGTKSLGSCSKQTTSLWVGAGKNTAATSSAEPESKNEGASPRARVVASEHIHVRPSGTFVVVPRHRDALAVLAMLNVSTMLALCVCWGWTTHAERLTPDQVAQDPDPFGHSGLVLGLASACGLLLVGLIVTVAVPHYQNREWPWKAPAEVIIGASIATIEVQPGSSHMQHADSTGSDHIETAPVPDASNTASADLRSA